MASQRISAAAIVVAIAALALGGYGLSQVSAVRP